MGLQHGADVPGIHVCAAARKTWMAGHQGVYARLRRAMPGHDGVIQYDRVLLWREVWREWNQKAALVTP